MPHFKHCKKKAVIKTSHAPAMTLEMGQNMFGPR